MNLVRPTSDKIKLVAKCAGVEEAFIYTALDAEESPRVEKNSDEGTDPLFNTLSMGIVPYAFREEI